jgi:hypothetical protein
MNRIKLLPFAIAVALFLPALATASNKALLIGVGTFEHPCTSPPQPPCVPNLPGIDLDVQRMHRLALNMGFAESQIHTLMDQHATIAAIQAELKGWFRQGVGPNDRLLLYFSSHGSLAQGKNGPIGIIIPYDVAFPPNSIANVLPGPELADLLESNPSHNIMLIVDACHSGGLMNNKSVDRDIVVKFLRYPGMPNGSLEANLFDAGMATKGIGQPNYGYLSACTQKETAGATDHGSLLTLALEDGWSKLRKSNQRASLEAAHPLILGFIRTNSNNPQHPELYGDANLLKADWFGGPRQEPAPGPGPSPSPGRSQAWELLENIARQAAGPIPARISKGEYRKGERLELSVDVPREGYLFILSVGEGDEKPALLFPNQYQDDNHVQRGSVQIPAAGARWHITQGLPSGMNRQNVVLVVVLSHARDTLKELTSGAGPFKDVDVPQDATRSPFVEPNDSNAPPNSPSGYLATKVTYLIKE